MQVLRVFAIKRQQLLLGETRVSGTTLSSTAWARVNYAARVPPVCGAARLRHKAQLPGRRNGVPGSCVWCRIGRFVAAKFIA
jgi:hypothetical protein